MEAAPEVNEVKRPRSKDYREIGLKPIILRELIAGDKKLSLIIQRGARSRRLYATTIIKNRPDVEKAEGATSALYKRALEIMKDYATQRQSAVSYSLETTNEKMINWALNQGQEIFQWDFVDQGDGALVCDKEIIPNLPK